jgi:hypothetical protein
LCDHLHTVSQPSQRVVPRDFARYATVKEIEADSKTRQIWRTSFYISGCFTQRTIALSRPIFKQKKGFAKLLLPGLISTTIL